MLTFFALNYFSKHRASPRAVAKCANTNNYNITHFFVSPRATILHSGFVKSLTVNTCASNPDELNIIRIERLWTDCFIHLPMFLKIFTAHSIVLFCSMFHNFKAYTCLKLIYTTKMNSLSLVCLLTRNLS